MSAHASPSTEPNAANAPVSISSKISAACKAFAMENRRLHQALPIQSETRIYLDREHGIMQMVLARADQWNAACFKGMCEIWEELHARARLEAYV